MERPYDRRGLAPWVWVLIVLGALLLVFVIWWAVAAQDDDQTVIVPGDDETRVVPPPMTTPRQTTPSQPVVIERERPVNIYVERNQPEPRVIVVPADQQPPEASDRMSRIDLPSRFRYQEQVWEPSDQAIAGPDVNLQDTGASINGNVIYAKRDAQAPYNEIFIETNPGSGVYVRYERTD